MSKAKVKSSIEKFSDTLPENEKIFLSDYLQKPKYESLSNTFDELLKKKNETKKANN